MKNYFILIIFCAFFYTANSQNIFGGDEQKDIKIEKKSDNNDVKSKTEDKKEISDATIDFVSKVVDYGIIDHNSDGNREFIFTNNGSEPLVIKNAKGSCGCTVPTWPRDPIAPGVTEKIKVKYATNRVGKFTKTITLTTNASKRPVILTIKGEVNPPPKDATFPEKDNSGAPLEK